MKKYPSIKVCIILSQTSFALPMQWFVDYIDRNKFEVSFILLNNTSTPLENYLLSKKISVKRVNYVGKKSFLSTFLKTFFYLLFNRPSIVHCHLFDASVIGLMASRLLFIKKRIYTRHHSTNNLEYYPGAVKYDKLTNLLATNIIAISPNVAHILHDEEKVSQNKITTITHGFDLKEFDVVDSKRIVNLKKKHTVTGSPVIGVIARYVEWKGIQYIIPAFKKLLNEYPDAVLVLANTEGNYKTDIKRLLSVLPKKNYVEIIFEEDIVALYKIMDVHTHVPINKNIEAFGQTYIEALASGTPSVFTLSGIAVDFIEHKFNAWVVPFKKSEEILNGITTLLKDKELRDTLITNGKKSTRVFDYANYIEKLEKLYLS